MKNGPRLTLVRERPHRVPVSHRKRITESVRNIRILAHPQADCFSFGDEILQRDAHVWA